MFDAPPVVTAGLLAALAAAGASSAATTAIGNVLLSNCMVLPSTVPHIRVCEHGEAGNGSARPCGGSADHGAVIARLGPDAREPARAAAAQLAHAGNEQREQLAGRAERVRDAVLVVDGDRRPDAAVDLGHEDEAARRACRVELREP